MLLIEVGDLELQGEETSEESDMELKRWLDELDTECHNARSVSGVEARHRLVNYEYDEQ